MQKMLTEKRTILIDSIGGQNEVAWWGGCCGTLKAVHYKFPPCVVLEEDDATDSIGIESEPCNDNE